jgi:vitamin K-dependent gamma-carboxylase
MEINRAQRPVDGASLAAFRVLFGGLMAVAVLRFALSGKIHEHFAVPTHFFSYWGLGWVKPLPEPAMVALYAAMAGLALCVAAGVATRAAAALLGAAFAYAHLCDKTHYLNHYWLLVSVCVLLSFIPVNGRSSPAWTLWALRAQFALVYLYGGIAKLQPDWLLEAQPLRTWLAASGDVPLVGPYLGATWVAYAASWGGAIFDLGVVPALLWRPTRRFALAAVVGFHLATAALFDIGMFPLFMIAGATLFLDPDRPRRAFGRPAPAAGLARPSRAAAVAVGAFLALHAVLPLRHLLYPGDVRWTEEGFRFAWQVMVMQKDGSVSLRVVEPATGRRWTVAPARYLTPYQARMAATQPDMILELAHVAAADFRARGVRDPEVRVDAFVSMNGRSRSRIIDPDVDLARESDGLAPKPWILPLERSP